MKSLVLQAELARAPQLTEEVYLSAIKMADKVSLPYFYGSMGLGGLTSLMLALTVYYTKKQE